MEARAVIIVLVWPGRAVNLSVFDPHGGPNLVMFGVHEIAVWHWPERDEA